MKQGQAWGAGVARQIVLADVAGVTRAGGVCFLALCGLTTCKALVISCSSVKIQ